MAALRHSQKPPAKKGWAGGQGAGLFGRDAIRRSAILGESAARSDLFDSRHRHLTGIRARAGMSNFPSFYKGFRDCLLHQRPPTSMENRNNFVGKVVG